MIYIYIYWVRGRALKDPEVDSLKAAYNFASKACKKAYIRADAQRVARIGQELITHPTLPYYWRLAKAVQKTFCQPSLPPLRCPDGTLAHKPQEKADLLAKLFAANSRIDNCNALPPSLPHCGTTMPDIKIRQCEVRAELQSLDVRKASGPDGIPAVVLKKCATELSPVLTRLYQCSYSLGRVPETWRDANVQPVPKKGDRSDPANYRSIACKTLPLQSNISMLGMEVRSDLNPKVYIKTVIKTASRKLGVLNKVWRSFTPDQLCLLYKTQVRSYVEYCSHLWDGSAKYLLDALDRLQRRAIRIIGDEECSEELFSLIPPSPFLQRTTRAGLRCHRLTVATIPTRTKKFGDSFLCRTIRKWNALPAHVFPPSYNLGSFKRGVKKQHAGRQGRTAVSAIFASGLHLHLTSGGVDASGMFAQMHIDDFYAIMRKRAASLLCRVRASSNSILQVIGDDLQIYEQAPIDQLGDAVLATNSDLDKILEWSKSFGLEPKQATSVQNKQPAAAPAPSSDAAALNSQITAQGDLVRSLKTAKAEKAKVDEAVKVLLDLKAKYKAATGQDWKPGVTPTATPSAAIPSGNSQDLDQQITKQGDLVRSLKAAKAEKAKVDEAVKTLLELKAKYKAATGKDWKPGVAPPATTTTSTGNNELDQQIVKQGDLVRSLKAAKAEKAKVDEAVKALLDLKAKYKAATGQDWKPGTNLAPVANQSTTNSQDLDQQITKQGDLVRSLKAAKAEKAKVDEAVKVLLDLKAKYKTATGQDWKPGSVAPLQQSNASAEALSAQIAAQGEKVRKLKGEKADKATVDAEVKTLLSLKAQYKSVELFFKIAPNKMI
ncbi:hypothetical protein evm_010741 [Chilo suppressalis]|nr:hypothetical protein evm_010741 [Chilo suppressalis]